MFDIGDLGICIWFIPGSWNVSESGYMLCVANMLLLTVSTLSSVGQGKW